MNTTIKEPPVSTAAGSIFASDIPALHRERTLSVWSLASGSKANCTLIKTAAASILIDFGLSCRSTERALREAGTDLSSVSGVFITHEHSDHIAGLPTFFKKYGICSAYGIPVHMTEPSYLAYIRGKGFEYRDNITVHPIDYSFRVGDMTIQSMAVPHDSAACVAYRITSDSGECAGICTDTGAPSERLLDFFSGCSDVITECNHDTVMLKCGIYPDELKRRILSNTGHTSNDDCAAFTVRLARRGVKNVLLAHISPENNTPELALYTVSEALREAGCRLERLVCAPRDTLFRFR